MVSQTTSADEAPVAVITLRFGKWQGRCVRRDVIDAVRFIVLHGLPTNWALLVDRDQPADPQYGRDAVQVRVDYTGGTLAWETLRRTEEMQARMLDSVFEPQNFPDLRFYLRLVQARSAADLPDVNGVVIYIPTMGGGIVENAKYFIATGGYHETREQDRARRAHWPQISNE